MVLRTLAVLLGVTSTCCADPFIDVISLEDGRGAVLVITEEPGSLAAEIGLAASGLEIFYPIVNTEVFDKPNPGDNPFIAGSKIGGDSEGLWVNEDDNQVFLSFGTPDLQAGTFELFRFGFSGSGSIDVSGVVAQNGNLGEVLLYSSLPVTNALPNGDFNGDSLVDAADYVIWKDSVGRTGGGLDADANGDGTVDSLDYTIWSANYGFQATRSQSTSVPEPGAVFLLVVCASCQAFNTRR